MILYLLDTDTCSYIAKRSRPSVVRHYDQVKSDEWPISAICYAELMFGIEPFPPMHPLPIKVKAFLFSATILDWPTSAAAAYADIKNRSKQQPLAEQDTLIAAHAIALDATLVTNNTRHFSRMGGGLKFENWLE